jgi:2-methylisocitrate lyase-like PEP mutase family enzyme
MHGAGELEALGFSLVFFPGGIVRALARTAQDYYASLHANGSNAPFIDRIHDFGGLNEVIGTADMLATANALRMAMACIAAPPPAYDIADQTLIIGGGGGFGRS